jgi:hypothetical protein
MQRHLWWCREIQRRHRRKGQAAVYDNGDAALAGFNRDTSAAVPMQRQAAHKSAAVLAEPTMSGSWDTKTSVRERRRSLWVKILRAVPFIKSWGGLL